MTPYYDHAGIIIFNCDCRDILPSLTADVVVTDPPYGIDAGNTKFGRAEIGGGDWDRETAPDVVNAAVAMTRQGIVWGGNYYALPPSKCWLVWDKARCSASDAGGMICCWVR